MVKARIQALAARRQQLYDRYAEEVNWIASPPGRPSSPFSYRQLAQGLSVSHNTVRLALDAGQGGYSQRRLDLLANLEQQLDEDEPMVFGHIPEAVSGSEYL